MTSDGPWELLLVVGQTLAIYVFLVVTLARLGRSLMAGLSYFNYLVVALLGSAVETGLYRGSAGLLAGLVSAATLLLANRGVSFLMCRWPRLRRLLAGGPVVLVHDGRIVWEHLRQVRLSEQDVRAAVRKLGYEGLEEVRLAVMESSGEVAVIARGNDKQGGSSTNQ